MSFCIRCSNFECGFGVISVNWDTRSQINPIPQKCTINTGSTGGQTPVATPGGSFNFNPETGTEYSEGPITGTVSIQAYAFSEGDDKWLGSRCITRAQATQSNLVKFDGNTKKHYIIPSETHSAQISGEPIDSLEMVVLCSTRTLNSQLLAGSVSLTTEMGTDLGHSFSYTGGPLPVSFPDKRPKKILNVDGCYQSSFSLDIDYPNSPARATYGWQFVLDCED